MNTKVFGMVKEKLKPYVEERWLNFIAPILESSKILPTLTERKRVATIVPKQVDMFNCFKYTPFDKVKVVILGQTPYHSLVNGEPEAHGLAFSYRKKELDFHVPQSLAVIRNEIETDVYNGEMITFDPNLERWAKQGVLLLNTALTTELGSKDAHIELWQPFTEEVIKTLNELNSGLIFCLWGNHAKGYAHLINKNNHILSAGHPASELYGGKGSFYGCKHFSAVNNILKGYKQEEIEW